VKVLHVAPSIEQSYGGPTQSLAGYAIASRAAGITVSVAAPRCSSEDVDSFSARAGAIDLHLFPSVGKGGFVTSPSLVKWVGSAAKSFDAVHVHGLFNPTSSFSARAAITSRAPTVIRPFGTLSKYTFHHRRTSLKRAYFGAIDRRNLQGVRAVHFTTDRERDEAAWHGIDFLGRAYFIPPPSIDDESAATPARDIDDGNVLFLGRVNPIKNLESLIDAWPLVRRRAAHLILEIVGDGEPAYVASLRDRVIRNGTDSSVVFRGFLTGDKKAAALARATVVVLPSHHDNFCVAAVEAISAGIPVVVSREVHLADFVERENLGKVVSGDSASLADAIVSVAGDSRLRDHVGTRGRQLVVANFSPAAIGQLLSRMYEAITERKAEPAKS
jgi:glycosyltransferase involved in cell wall biosynthesis